MGRCGRQGQDGSYSMVLCRPHLERAGFDKGALQRWLDEGRLHERLREDSARLYGEACAGRPANAKRCLASHTETAELYAKFATNGAAEPTRAEMRIFLKTRNPDPIGDGITRVVIALDATGSMTHSIETTKATIAEMLRRCGAVIDAAGIEPGTAKYALQIVAYRNYNAVHSSELLQVSEWADTAAPLETFLGTVDASYGWGEEAVELALAHANRELADLVIVLGDADAQVKAEVMRKRTESHNHAWNSDVRFAAPTDFETETKKLADRDCTVSTFYVSKRKDPPRGFVAMAAMTGGQARTLNLAESADGADALTKAVCCQILARLGGEDLADMYDQAVFAN